MPFGADPDARRWYVLKADRGKPRGQRPRFCLRYLTKREHRKYRKLGDDRESGALDAADIEEVDSRLYAELATVLAGWERLTDRDGKPVAFDPARLDVLADVLTNQELWDLYYAGGTDLDEADLVFSAGPADSRPGESATALVTSA